MTKMAQSHVSPQGSLRVDLRAAFGEPESASVVPERVTRMLVPDLEDAGYVGVLATAVEGMEDVDEALALCTALVLTSPEYHLV